MTLEREHAKDAIWAAAADREHVLVLCTSEPVARCIMDYVREVLPEGLPVEVRHYNGDKSVSFPSGGRMQFLSLPALLRGYRFDRVFAPPGLDDRQRRDIDIVMATSKVGIFTEY